MGYKFQVGAFNAAGALTQVGDVDADTFDVTGSALSGSGNITAGTNIISAGPYILHVDPDDAGSSTVAITGDTVANAKVLLSCTEYGAGVEGKLTLRNNSDEDILVAGSSQSEQHGYLQVNDASGDAQATFTAADAKIVNTGDFTCTSVVTVTNNVAVGGNLIVNGTTVQQTTNQTSIEDPMIHINANAGGGATDSHGTGFMLGEGGGAYGALVTLQSASAAGVYLDFKNSNDSAYIPAEAASLWGDCSKLTGVKATSIKYEPDTFIAGNALVEGLNLSNADLSSDITVGLTASSFAAGAHVRVKAKNLTNSAKITISLNGSETADGEGSIELASPYGSVELIFNGSSWEIV